MVKYFCRPSTFRRRMLVLSAGCGLMWTDGYLMSRELCAIPRLNAAKSSHDRETIMTALSWYPVAFYGIGGDGHTNRERHRAFLKNRLTDEMLARYAAQEESWSRNACVALKSSSYIVSDAIC